MKEKQQHKITNIYHIYNNNTHPNKPYTLKIKNYKKTKVQEQKKY